MIPLYKTIKQVDFMRVLKPLQSFGEWKFTDPDTLYPYTAQTKTALIQKIVSYRAANKLFPIEELGAVIDNYLCSLPENRGKCCPAPKLKRGMLQYVQGGIRLLKNIAYKDAEMVEQEVADQRAEQCKDCKFNIFPDKGPFLRWTDEIAEHSVGDRKTKFHEELGNCEVCSCVNKAKVFYKGPFDLTEEQKEKMWEVFCWQLKE